MTAITARMFEEATGLAPENDDLERVNCPEAGKPSHRQCGWDTSANLPRYVTGNFDAQGDRP